MPGEQIREVKMIPRSMWRQHADSSSTKDKELKKFQQHIDGTVTKAQSLAVQCHQFTTTKELSYSLLRIPAQFKKKHVEIYFFKSKSVSYHQSRRQRYLMACFSFTLALACKQKESKWWAFRQIKKRNRPSYLPRAYLPCRNKQRRMQTAQSNQPSRRSLI
ncbi:hypothetical protein ACFX11_038869 [Malus domestica]